MARCWPAYLKFVLWWGQSVKTIYELHFATAGSWAKQSNRQQNTQKNKTQIYIQEKNYDRRLRYWRLKWAKKMVSFISLIDICLTSCSHPTAKHSYAVQFVFYCFNFYAALFELSKVWLTDSLVADFNNNHIKNWTKHTQLKLLIFPFLPQDVLQNAVMGGMKISDTVW